MKKLIIPIFLLLFVFACTDQKKGSNNNSTEQIASRKDTAVRNASEAKMNRDTLKVYKEEPHGADKKVGDTIAFEKYAVAIDELKEKAKLDFDSNPGALPFKSRITNGYNSNDINFAGHYIGIAFGCGGGCIMGFIVDVRDGKIYDAPLGEANMCVWTIEMNIYKPQSRLYISSVCKEQSDSMDLFYKAYVWDEKEKVFKKVELRKLLYLVDGFF